MIKCIYKYQEGCNELRRITPSEISYHYTKATNNIAETFNDCFLKTNHLGYYAEVCICVSLSGVLLQFVSPLPPRGTLRDFTLSDTGRFTCN